MSGNRASLHLASPSEGEREKKHRLGAQIVEVLKKRILQWEYPPGFPLGEESLGREFSVSRSPVREALHSLEAAGFVHRMPNRGYTVRQVFPAEVDELYDLRLALELHALDGLTIRPETAGRLHALLQEWREKPREGRDGRQLAEDDEAFHEALAALYGNTALVECLKGINQRLFIFRMIDFEQPDRMDTTCMQHMEILHALLARDRARARAALQANVEAGRRYVDRSLRDALVRSYCGEKTRHDLQAAGSG